MLRNGRVADQDFSEPAEPLYHRCCRDMLDPKCERILGAKVVYKNMSVNRGRYSEPEDVIFDHPMWGIIGWTVADIPSNVVPPQGRGDPFSFRPAHVPEELNYAHSEVWAFKNGRRIEKPDPSTEVKKLFRQIMSDRSRVLRVPAV
jgi:hypothetical protein